MLHNAPNKVVAQSLPTDYTGFLFEPRFYTTDPVALQYILSHADDFPKSDRMRKQLAEILGEGVLFAEGADHRRQRKIMNP